MHAVFLIVAGLALSIVDFSVGCPKGIRSPPQIPKDKVHDLPLQCSFTYNFCGFDQPWTGQGMTKWKRWHGGTPSEETGPKHDRHGDGGGVYLYLESSAPVVLGSKAILLTPTLKSLGQYCLRFSYHMHGKRMGALQVYEVSGSRVPRIVWSGAGNRGDEWFNIAYTGRMIGSFKGVAGGRQHSDIGLDDISLTNGVCGRMQTPQLDPSNDYLKKPKKPIEKDPEFSTAQIVSVSVGSAAVIGIVAGSVVGVLNSRNRS